jgi:transposase
VNEINKKIDILKEASYVGIDLAKKIFGVVVTDKDRKILHRKMIKTSDFLSFVGDLPPTVTFFMEACGMSQFWGRELGERGLSVKIVPAQYVKPFVQMGKKNDLNDAMAVIEAGLKDGIHFVPVKSAAQRDVGALVNRREQLVENKVKLQNQTHAIFRENGIALSEKKTTKTFITEAYSALEFLKVSFNLRLLIGEMLEELNEIARKIELVSETLKLNLDQMTKEPSVATTPVKRMLTVYGVGPITVATMFAHLGNLK